MPASDRSRLRFRDLLKKSLKLGVHPHSSNVRLACDAVDMRFYGAPTNDVLRLLRDALRHEDRAEVELEVAREDVTRCIALCRSGGYSYRQMAHSIVGSTGDPKSTNDERRRVTDALRQRDYKARRTAAHANLGRSVCDQRSLPEGYEGKEIREMENKVIRKRVTTTEEWFEEPADGEGVSDLDAGDQDQDRPEEQEREDCPPPRPTPTRLRRR